MITIRKHPDHNRYRIVGGTKVRKGHQGTEMEIEIKYRQKENEGMTTSKAVLLDNDVIPDIQHAVTAYPKLVKLIRTLAKSCGFHAAEKSLLAELAVITKRARK